MSVASSPFYKEFLPPNSSIALEQKLRQSPKHNKTHHTCGNKEEACWCPEGQEDDGVHTGVVLDTWVNVVELRPMKAPAKSTKAGFSPIYRRATNSQHQAHNTSYGTVGGA